VAAADTKRDGDFAGCQVPVGPHHRTPRQRRPTNEAANWAALLFLSSFLFHDLDVSVSLVCKHNPGAREICQEPG